MITLLEDVADLPPVCWPKNARCDRIILRSLIDAQGWVSRSRLVDAIWGDREDGGPENTRNILDVRVCYLRRQLRPGFHIESDHNHHLRLAVEQDTLEQLMLKRVAGTLAA